MILKKLRIENFGKINFFESSFDPQCTVLSDDYADDIIKAIGLVTNNKTLFGATEWQPISNRTHISAVLEMHDGTFMLCFTGKPPNSRRNAFESGSNKPVNTAKLLDSICLCEEEESLIYYRFDCKNIYAERLFRYKTHDKYYSDGEFETKTDGLGITKSFRTYLTHYIKEYNTEQVFLNDKVRLLPNGKFVRFPAKISDKNFEIDNNLFEYMCCLSVRDFWEQFENIRNMYYENWPSIVDTAGLLSVPEYKKLLFQPENAKRQLIIKG